jgi:periplasmic protein CpxP/Spy
VTQTISTTSTAARTRARVRMLLLGVLVAATASWAVTSWAQPVSWGRHHHEGAMGGGMGGPMATPRMLDRMLDGLNATDEQRAQIRQIGQAAAADLQAQRQAARDLRQRSLEIFTTPTVDAAAAESVRQQLMALHDQASKRMLQAMVDVSRVLTPEQRAKIGERIKERAARHQERMESFQREHRQPR